MKSVLLSGFSWSVFDYILNVLIQFVALVTYTRVLDAEAYGIFAFCTIFSTFGNSVFALGMAPALIREKRDFTYYANVAWTANLIVSVFAFILISIFLPTIMTLVSSDFKDIQLEMHITLLVILISGFSNIGMVDYMKRLNLKPVLLYNISPKMLALIIGILLALNGFEHWALIISLLVESLSRVLISYLICAYRPVFEWDWEKFTHLYSFGGWLQLKNIASWGSNQVDSIAMSSVSGSSGLGFYNRSLTISRLLENSVVKVINTVTYPYLAGRIQSQDLKDRFVATIASIVVLIMIYANFIVFNFGSELVVFLFGNDWIEIMNYLPLLILAGTIQSIINIYQPLIRVNGRTKLEFILFSFKTVILIIALYLFIPLFLIDGILYGLLLSNILTVLLMIFELKKFSNDTLISLRNALVPTLLFIVSICVFRFTNIYVEMLYFHVGFILAIYSVLKRYRDFISG